MASVIGRFGSLVSFRLAPPAPRPRTLPTPATIALWVALLLTPAPSVRADETTSSNPAPPSLAGYFSASAQIGDPLQPFAGLPPGSRVRIRSAVVSLPDPLETRLARAFDIELAALISAFQTRGYVLDGFAFAWRPGAARRPGEADKETSPLTNDARDRPSLLLLRKDDWREGGAEETSTSYYALFIVGETPTWGVHPVAFQRAARCALLLNRGDGVAVASGGWRETDCDKAGKDDWPPADSLSLDVIGPAFSGSMESVVVALANVSEGEGAPPARDFGVRLLSPSTTVKSNAEVVDHPLVRAENGSRISYLPIAPTLDRQLNELLSYLSDEYAQKGLLGELLSDLDRFFGGRPGDRVVLLAEASSFGQGAVSISRPDFTPEEKGPDRLRRWVDRLDVVPVQFPPNIASIRAEHAELDRQADEQRRDLLPTRLLELDLSDVERRRDRPPVYQPSLTSRSDELALYRTFDALNTWVEPIAVVIVATDVRDRLFLIREVRSSLPKTLTVVLEQDNLLVHPDYRHVDRGTVVVPAGDTLVMLADENGDGTYTTLLPRSRSHLMQPRQYFSFATDYAANTFRAGILLLNTLSHQGDAESGGAPFTPDPPLLLTATLAGFQSVEKVERGGGGSTGRPVPGRSAPEKEVAAGDGDESRETEPAKRFVNVLIAADTRIQLQQPFYLGLVAIGLTVLALALQLAGDRDSGRIVEPLWQAVAAALPWRRREDRTSGQPEWMLRRQPWKIAVLAVCGASVMAIGAWRALVIQLCGMRSACFANQTFDLAHGRDAWALVAIVLLLACTGTVALMRLQVWNRRCEEFACEPSAGAPLLPDGHRHGTKRALVAGAVVLVGLGMFVGWPGPRAVDAPVPSALAGFGVVSVGGFFVVLFWMQLARLQRVSRVFAKTMEVVRQNGGAQGCEKKKGEPSWPTPELLGEAPGSPFHMTPLETDLDALRRCDPMKWIQNTAQMTSGSWPFSGSVDGLKPWQARLAAEMKIASVGLRSTAWCAVIAPAAALAMMQVYPPGLERLQVRVSVAFVALGFAAVVYGALALEKDRLLGRMFTRNKDELGLGKALGIVWPKVLAFGLLLAAAFLPEVWDWVHGFAQAIGVVGNWVR